LQIVGSVTLITVIGATGTFYYITNKERNPGPQLPFDPSKKTIVVLGSGWGATSLLKRLDTEDYNTVVISPKNFFLFTPLLPSVAVGTLGSKSILQPTRYITRHKTRQVSVVEAEATSVDPVNKTVTFTDSSPLRPLEPTSTIHYDYLVYAVGAETQTFGIPGVKEHACFMKEIGDAEELQGRLLDCVETAAFPGTSEEEKRRLLHMVVVGGGPTGIEVAGELHDFLEEDLKSWYPELHPYMRLTLVEALPSVLPMFSKELIAYTERTFKESRIDIMTATMVKGIKPTSVLLASKGGPVQDVDCGLVVWAAGNTSRQLTKDLMAKLPTEQTNKRGILIDTHLRMLGESSIFAIGDCTSTSYAPTAQVASQQGAYLARMFKLMAKRDALEAQLTSLTESKDKAEGASNDVVKAAEGIKKRMERIKLKPFEYSHQGSLAYIGSDKAIADLPIFGREWSSGGVATYLFWRSAYLSTLFTFRNRMLVGGDWLRAKFFGRDVSRE
jgi:NADH:ubiquinone reductase (non-electrogenic)